jgi:hypothetical protein
VTGRLPPEPARVLFSFADSCPDPCYCGYRGTEAECPPNPRADTLSGASDDIGPALAEVRGLALSTTVLRAQARISLPPVLLQVKARRRVEVFIVRRSPSRSASSARRLVFERFSHVP